MSAGKTTLPMLSGKPMHIVGLGTWQSKSGEVKEAVKIAIEAGYKHIDTARGYYNEGEIGEALEEMIKAGRVTREELFITTKVLNCAAALPHRVRQQTEISLKLLKTSYIDLLLIHFPIAFEDSKLDDTPPSFLPFSEKGEALVSDVDYLDTYKEMEKLVDAGLVKALGLSNFSIEQVKRVWDAARIKPTNNQVECHAWFPQHELTEFCQSKGMTLSAYGPIGSPGSAAIRGSKTSDVLLEDPVVVKLAEKLKKTPAQILMRYLIQRNIIVLPKSVNRDRIISNLQLFDFELSDAEMEEMKSINREERLFTFASFFKGDKVENHPHLPWPKVL
ncbi:hypothetical protein EB796_008050 [Bugula neritina]|uniref:NADP-dependent oxidoreductase domain-containing protein n=1 Tax=Bugula neritina TaxID=10212 RepID=A0A7J7K6Q7_BUGNE|nr:hypothetical protein EB796_008050 [Bugula neritina]